MTDDTDVNWKAKGAAAVAWMRLHPEFTVPAGTFLLGLVVGWVLL